MSLSEMFYTKGLIYFTAVMKFTEFNLTVLFKILMIVVKAILLRFIHLLM